MFTQLLHSHTHTVTIPIVQHMKPVEGRLELALCCQLISLKRKCSGYIVVASDKKQVKPIRLQPQQNEGFIMKFRVYAVYQTTSVWGLAMPD